MKESPILFRTPMVQAILDGRKSMTRRVVKLPPSRGKWEPTTVGGPGCYYDKKHTRPAIEETAIWNTTTGQALTCPYGIPGDRLWVKETWCCDNPAAAQDAIPSLDGAIYYKATEEHPDLYKWKSALFMPRWASRITLEITNVRVERLQEITEEDAIKEGATPSIVGEDLDYLRYRAGFQSLWESINGKKHPWDSNPFCWVTSFRRLH